MKTIALLSTLLFCSPGSADEAEDLRDVLESAKMVPVIKDGTVTGHKIVALKPGSNYEKLGLRKGDVIQAINGEPVTSPQQAMELYQNLKKEESTHYEIRRSAD